MMYIITNELEFPQEVVESTLYKARRTKMDLIKKEQAEAREMDDEYPNLDYRIYKLVEVK